MVVSNIPRTGRYYVEYIQILRPYVLDWAQLFIITVEEVTREVSRWLNNITEQKGWIRTRHSSGQHLQGLAFLLPYSPSVSCFQSATVTGIPVLVLASVSTQLSKNGRSRICSLLASRIQNGPFKNLLIWMHFYDSESAKLRSFLGHNVRLRIIIF